jgi:energy-coupling factor transporter ATP-binding protein EcfA2
MKINGLYYDKYVGTLLDIFCKRYNKKLDNLIVVTGREGSGKSSFAIGLCAAYAHLQGFKFDVDDITFSAEEFLKRATHRKNGIILYDEAVQGLMGQQWQNKTQQLVVQALMMARKNRNLYVLCIPSFEYLTRYVASERTFVLFEAYMNKLERGFVNIYSQQKLKLKYHYAKTHSNKTVSPSRFGRFADHSHKVIDKEAYEAKKDEAIQKLTDSLAGPIKKETKRYYQLIDKLEIDSKLLAGYMGIALRTAQHQKKEAKRYMENG